MIHNKIVSSIDGITRKELIRSFSSYHTKGFADKVLSRPNDKVKIYSCPNSKTKIVRIDDFINV